MSFGNRYPPLVGGPGKGRIGTTGRPENANMPISSGTMWLDSFGSGRYQLGPMISSPGNVWNDLDLFQITAANNLVISNVFVWKMIATSSMNSITTILAPKIAIPDDVYTFTGKSMYYNIQPANEVPKRGTVRTMTKSYEEFKVHLSQKGMGSKIEGGTMRTKQGAQFLDQEIVAIAWSLELNMALNTVTTLVNAAIASGFNFNRVDNPMLNALTYAHQIDREIKAFCIGAGSHTTLATQITDYIQVVPNADVMYMSKRLETNLTFNTESAGRDLPHKTYAMIPDESGNAIPVTIRGANGTRTTKTIFGSISVLTMPTFNFRNGEIKYNPLEHEFSCGNHWIMNAESGFVPWDKLVVPTNDSSVNYSSEMLNAKIYSHDLDKRDLITFIGAMKNAHVFGSDAPNYNFLDVVAGYDRYRHGIFSKHLIDFTADLNVPAKKKEMNEAIKHSTNYLNSLPEKSVSVNEPPTHITGSNLLSNHFYKAVQSFKANVQFPISRSLHFTAPNSIDANEFKEFVLPTFYGDLDAFHLMGINFKSMISDVKRRKEMINIFTSDQYQSFCDLKKILNKPGSLNLDYWNLVAIMNRKLLEDGDAAGDHNYFGISPYFYGSVKSALHGWAVQTETNFMVVPTADDYNNYLQAIGKQNFLIQPEDYVPQGLWSVSGLRCLSNQSFLKQTRISKLASDSLAFLNELTKTISDFFPFSSICNSRDMVKTVKRFLDPNTIVAPHDYSASTMYGDKASSSAVSDLELMQIIFSLLDDPQDRVAVGLRPYPANNAGTIDTTKSAYSVGKSLVSESFISGQDAVSQPTDLYLVKKFSVSVNGAGAVVITVPKEYSTSPLEKVITITPPSAASPSVVRPDVIVKRMKAGNFSSASGTDSILNFLKFGIHKLLGNPLATTASNTPITNLFGKPFVDSLTKIPELSDFQRLITTSTYGIVDTPAGPATASPINYLLTPFVVSKKTTSGMENKDATIGFFTMDGALTVINDADSVNKSEKRVMERYYTRDARFGKNGWMQLRWQEFVFKTSPGSQKSWNHVDRLLSAFLLETQLSLPGVERLISEGIRPPFEVCLWRLFQRQRFEGLLIAKAGISTAMNPYNNAHINMGTDATTDQYTLRAVLQTDCVVINPHNLIFVPCVSPSRYLGGRNNKFIPTAEDVLDTTLSSEKVPSIIATLVSYGYMATTDDPISFINSPPGRLINGSVMDVNLDTQLWPGASYYGRHVFKSLFYQADVSFSRGIKVGSDKAKEFQEWRRAQMDANHISTRGYKKVFDPFTKNYTIEEQGKGHYAYDFMNDTGAKRVFEGIDSVFPVYVRAPNTNT